MPNEDYTLKGLYEFWVVKACSIISITSNILLIIIYFFKKKWTLSMYVNFNVCISAIIFSISGLFPIITSQDNNRILCGTQVLFGGFGDPSILLWTATISVIGMLSYKYQDIIKDKIVKICSFGICYGIPLIFDFLFYTIGEIKVMSPNYYCWISNHSVKLFYSIFIVIIFIINIIANVILLVEVKSIKSTINDNDLVIKKLNKFSCILWNYIIALIIMYLNNIIHKVYYFNNEGKELPIIIDVSLQGLNFLKGFIIYVCYTFNEETISDIKKLFTCSLKKESDALEENLNPSTEEYEKNYYNAIDFFDDPFNDSTIEIPV